MNLLLFMKTGLTINKTSLPSVYFNLISISRRNLYGKTLSSYIKLILII